MVLVGSTGQGKSALGNFLLDPVCFENENETFPVGDSNQSCTSECKVDERNGIRVMDTPGLNDSRGSKQDLGHVIEVVKQLHQLGSVHAFVLVARLEGRLDKQWMETLRFYIELLGKDTLAPHLVVVLNKTVTKPKKTREDSNSSNKAEIQKRLEKVLGSDFKAMVFIFDAEPHPEAPSRVEEAQRSREEFVEYVEKQVPVSVKGLQVPKTLELLQEDKEKVAGIDGQMNQLGKKLKELKAIPDHVRLQQAVLVKQKARLETQLQAVSEKIDDNDTEELLEIPGTRWTYDYSWRSWQESKASFSITPDVPIRQRVASYPKTEVRLEERTVAAKEYSGRFAKFKWFRGWYCEVKLFGWKRDIYAGDLKRWQRERTKLMEELDTTDAKIMELAREYPAAAGCVREVSNEMQKLEAERERLLSPRMTVQEAEQRYRASPGQAPPSKRP